MLDPAKLGAGLSNPPKRFSARWKVIFFSSGLSVVFGALLGLWSCVGEIVSPFDIIVFSYLLAMGCVMLVLDSPYNHGRVQEVKYVIHKFCLFLTRFVGRGITYIFLGCMVCANLWDNSVAPFLGIVIFAVLVSVGVCAIYYGIRVTRKLDAVRKALLNRGGPSPSICPPQGIRIEKFGELAERLQGVHFAEEELQYIANALSLTVHADDTISQKEFEYWLKDPTPVMI